MKLRNLLSSAALSLALLAGTAIVASDMLVTPAAAAKAPTVSKAFAKPFSEARKLLDEGKLDELRLKIAEIDAIKEPKPYDSFILAQFKLQLAAKSNDFTAAAAAYETMLAGEFMPAEGQPSAYKLIMQVANNTKDYPKAIATAQTYTDKFGQDPEVMIQAGQAMYFSDRYAEASTMIQNAIKAQEANGGTSDRSWYDLWVSADLKAGGNKNDAAGNAIAHRLAKFSTGEDAKQDWLVLTDIEQRKSQFNDRLYAEIFRLMAKVDTLDPREYASAGRQFMQAKLYGDATEVLQKGVDAGYLKGADAGLLAQAKAEMAKDKAALVQIEAAAKTAPNGIGLLSLSTAYRNYHDGAKAVELANAAIAKGGLRNVDEAKLQLAFAKMEAGDKAGAAADLAALSTVAGPVGGLARLYAIYNSL